MWQKTKNYYHLFQALISAIYFQFPSKNLIVVGITGTDGKSTTASMIQQILKEKDKKAGLLTSLGAQIGTQNLNTGYHVTTPTSFQIQKLLKAAKDAGAKYFVLETTSHGLDQNRLAFINFKVAVLTNVSHEHLDYHKTFTNYLQAKSKLFKNAQISVLNLGDKSYDFVKKTAHGKVLSYGLEQNADFNPKSFPIKLKIAGEYNIENALAASACATALGFGKKTIIKALSNFENLPGRMQKVDLGQPFSLYIDFAHTPNALEKACQSLKAAIKKNRSRLIIVFGTASERDTLKRPMMGKIAAAYANISVLTAEDPRYEDPKSICLQIAKGLIQKNKKEGKDFYVIEDRKEAIRFAIKIAKKNDIVALFGKGHEKSMSYMGQELAWDETTIAKDALLKTLKK